MRLPRVNPVGLPETPRDFRTSPRAYSPPTRIAALAVLAIFSSVVVASTVYSLTAYCLTSQAGLATARFD